MKAFKTTRLVASRPQPVCDADITNLFRQVYHSCAGKAELSTITGLVGYRDLLRGRRLLHGYTGRFFVALSKSAVSAGFFASGRLDAPMRGHEQLRGVLTTYGRSGSVTSLALRPPRPFVSSAQEEMPAGADNGGRGNARNVTKKPFCGTVVDRAEENFTRNRAARPGLIAVTGPRRSGGCQ